MSAPQNKLSEDFARVINDCMHRTDAITVGHTEIVLASPHATLRYIRGAPCLKLKRYVSHIRLWRQRVN